MTSLREINILLSLKHDNIVNVSEVVVGSSLDSIFMVMEYVEHDLKELMRSHALRTFSVPQVGAVCFDGSVSWSFSQSISQLDGQSNLEFVRIDHQACWSVRD